MSAPQGFKARDFYRLGVALYRMYLTIEKDGTRFSMEPELDGRITSPTGMAELIERTLEVKLEQAGDEVRFHADPKHDVVEDDLAERGSGKAARQEATQGKARDEGAGPKRTRRAIPPDRVEAEEEAMTAPRAEGPASADYVAGFRAGRDAERERAEAAQGAAPEPTEDYEADYQRHGPIPGIENPWKRRGRR